MSSQAPWMKFWIADFVSDTQHLTAAEVGNHVRLMCRAWRRPSCSIPNDPAWIQRRLNIDEEQFTRDVLAVIREFWTEEGDELVNEVLRKEYFEVLARSDSARKAALTRHHGSTIGALKKKGNL